MTAVAPEVEILTDRLRSVYPMQDEPPFGATDFIGEYGASSIPRLSPDGTIISGNDDLQTGGVAGGIETDSLRKCVYARHLFVPHTQVWSPGGCDYSGPYHASATAASAGDPAVALPTLKWWNLQPISPTTAAPAPTQVAQSLGYKSLRVVFPDPVGGSFVMDGCAPRCQGFKTFLTVGQPTDGKTLAAGYSASARWRVTGSQNPLRWYSVQMKPGAGILFAYNDRTLPSGDPHPDFWVPVDTIKIGEGALDILTPQPGETALPMLDVRLLAGLMTVSIGSEDTPYPWPHGSADLSGGHDWYMDAFQVVGNNVKSLEWDFHPVKFTVNAGYVGTEINVGYVPNDNDLAAAVYVVHTLPNFPDHHTGQPLPPPVQDGGKTRLVGFLPDGCDCLGTTHDVNGTLLRYQLALTSAATGAYHGAPYADFTACVQAVSLRLPGLVAPQPPSRLTILGQNGATPNPESLTVTHSFDLSRLCVTRSASLTFNNFAGAWSAGDGSGFVDQLGHFGIEINLGMVGGPALQTEFIGVANTQFQNNWQGGGNDKVTLLCEDLWLFLDTPSWNLPYFDGWNVYAVMAYLAGLGTLTRSQLDFAPLVPDDPYDPSPGLADADQFFLPIGPAGTPLTRFSGGQHKKDIMLKISQSLGYWMYFDANSRLHFEKFRLPGAGAFVRTFSHRDGDPLTGPFALGAIWSGSYSGGLKEARNSATVIGVSAFGPLWNPIVAHSPDLASVYDDSQPNYKGFWDPIVWADNLFVDKAFAQKASDSLLAYLRLPDRQVGFSTWYQADGRGVYPGDMIAVITPRSGAALQTFFVTETRVTISIGQAARCDIQARIVPGAA